MTLCFKYDGGCDNITPPNCPQGNLTHGDHHHHHQHQHETRRRRAYRDSNTFDLFTWQLQIVDQLPVCKSPDSEKHSPKLILYLLITFVNLLLSLITAILVFRQKIL